MNRAELLYALEAAGHIDGAQRAAIEAAVSQPREVEPVGVKILAGMGGWIAALFLMPFLGLAFGIFKGSGKPAVLLGGALLAAAMLLWRRTSAVFLRQVALAVGMAGHISAVYGVVEMMAPGASSILGSVAAMHTAMAVALYRGFPSAVYRFLVAVAAAVLITVWIVLAMESMAMLHVLIAAETALLAWLVRSRTSWRDGAPLYYAAVCMLPATLVLVDLVRMQPGWLPQLNGPTWPSNGVLVAGLLALLAWLAGSGEALRRPRSLAVCGAILCLGVFATPGILVAIGLLVLGFAEEDRVVSTVACLFLVAFLASYYYALHVDLAYKSGVIASSGITLFALRGLLARHAPAEATP